MNHQEALKGPALIELRGVTKQFPTVSGTRSVLREIDLSVDRGEFVAIVGKSGSGKSTLLNMITGIDRPSQGGISINDTPVHLLDESRLARWRGKTVGIVFQFFQLIPTLSIRENLLLAMDFVGNIPKRDRSHRAGDLLGQVGILQHADRLPAALSGGEQQRAAIARALANDPPVLVADEPTGNLDTKAARAIQSVFLQLVRTGKTVIVVTHDTAVAAGCNRTILLEDGVIVSDTKSQAVRQEMRLAGYSEAASPSASGAAQGGSR